MTHAIEQTYEVFISHAAADAELAALIRREFADAGLNAFTHLAAENGNEAFDRIRDAIVEARAVVVLVTSKALATANLALEVGAAMAWHKPIVCVLVDVDVSAVPDFLARFRLMSVKDLHQVVEFVHSVGKPLTTDEQRALAEIYSSQRIPSDRLLTDYSALASLTKSFNNRAHRTTTPDQVLRNIVLMRKRGELPRLRKTDRVPSG